MQNLSDLGSVKIFAVRFAGFWIPGVDIISLPTVECDFVLYVFCHSSVAIDGSRVWLVERAYSSVEPKIN